jgi:hypothetical protein
MMAGVGLFAYLWLHSNPSPLAPSVAVQRFRQGERAHDPAGGPGPSRGIYLYRGSGTETISVPPKSLTEGPGFPGTVADRPGGCFDFRLDFSDAHWQSWTYCLRNGALVTSSKAGYYLWDFVAFSVDDTSTFTCSPAGVTIPARIVVGTHDTVSCTGKNDHLSIGPVYMKGTSTVVATKTLRVGTISVPAVRVREIVDFTGGQKGTNETDTWFSVAAGLPLRGTWSTVVSTPSPVGNSTLHASGDFTLESTTPQR